MVGGAARREVCYSLWRSYDRSIDFGVGLPAFPPIAPGHPTSPQKPLLWGQKCPGPEGWELQATHSLVRESLQNFRVNPRDGTEERTWQLPRGGAGAQLAQSLQQWGRRSGCRPAGQTDSGQPRLGLVEVDVASLTSFMNLQRNKSIAYMWELTLP